MTFDPSAICQHVAILHRLAKKSGHDGVLVLAAFGEGTASAQHFAIGDISGMTSAALAFQETQANVYALLAIMRSDLLPGKKGRIEDVVAVLGAVIDGDADKGKATPLPPAPANYVLETSTGNYQHFLLFDRALVPSEALPLLAALKRATGADCADDVSHVWRIPGALNWANAAKIRRGRSPNPQIVRVVTPWDGCSVTCVDDLRRTLQVHSQEPETVPKAPASSAFDVDPAKAEEFLVRLRDAGYFDAGPDARNRYVWATKACAHDLGDEPGQDIWQRVVCWNGERDGEGAAVDASEMEKRWRDCSTRTSGAVVTFGTLIADATKVYGWPKANLRRQPTSQEMFGDIAGNPNASLFVGRGSKQAELWMPVLKAVPHIDRNATHPLMPETGHPLRDSINAAIPGIILSGGGDALAVIEAVHPETAAQVVALIPNPDRAAIAARAAHMIEEIERAIAPMTDFQRDMRSGEIQNDNVDNVSFFLKQLSVEIRWNAWTERIQVEGWEWSAWTDVDDTIVAKLRMRASQTKTRFRSGKDFMWDALTALAHKCPVDPVLDLLADAESKWDGQSRIDTWLTIACGTPDDAYHRAVSRNIVGGIVRRARHPGIKFDTMTVLHGPEGTGKSTLASIFALKRAWFSDEIQLGDASKELVLSLAGKLVVEIGEMSARSSVGANHIKAMLSRQVDRGRTAYSRTVSTRPRRNIFIGTTNSKTPLKDPEGTGNRRFLPVHVARTIDLDWLRDACTQIVGEAARLESLGETFDIPREVWAEAGAMQAAATERPEYEGSLREWLAPTGLDVYMTMADLSQIVTDAAGRPVNSTEYNGCIESLGFQRASKRVDGRTVEVWFRNQRKGAYRITAASLRMAPRGVRLSMGADDAAQSPAPAAPPQRLPAIPSPSIASTGQ